MYQPLPRKWSPWIAWWFVLGGGVVETLYPPLLENWLVQKHFVHSLRSRISVPTTIKTLAPPLFASPPPFSNAFPIAHARQHVGSSAPTRSVVVLHFRLGKPSVVILEICQPLRCTGNFFATERNYRPGGG